MQALCFSEGELLYRREYPKPQPDADAALIRLSVAGICSTDLEIVKGYTGFQGILGHEFVGIVEAADDTQWLDRRVVGSINLGCGSCPYCAQDGSEHCPRRTVLGIIDHDGAFADYLSLPLSNLFVVPDSVPDELAVFTEPLAAALRIREQIAIRPSTEVAVVGPGRLGLLIGLVLALAGTRVTMLGRRPESLALPKQLGMRIALVDAPADNSFDMVVEATGNEGGLSQALRLVRPLGTMIMKSTYAGLANVDMSRIVVDEITIVGSRCGPFGPALRMLAKGELDLRPMIEAEYPLKDGLTAFSHAARPGVRKVLLRP